MKTKNQRWKKIASLGFSELYHREEANQILNQWQMGVESNIIALGIGATTNQVNTILRKLALL
jgi:hypothetical protein